MPILRDLMASSRRSLKSLPALTGTRSAASVNVTPERSLQVGAVYASIRLLSESIASLPAGLYKRTPDYRSRVEAHPLKALLLEDPNPVIDSGEYWRSVMGWMLLRGNAIVYVQRNNAGRPIGLWPISPANVEIKRADTGRLMYKLNPDQLSEYVPVKSGYVAKPHEVLHYRAFGLGVEGLSPIAMARQQIGTSFAASSYIGGFFARDASPGGIVSVEGKLDDKQYDRLTEQWKSLHEGFDNSHKLAVMEGGAKWEKTTLSPADAEFLQVYKLTRTEIASIFGIPPHMIGDLDRATFSNIEQQSLEFVIHSLRPWLVRLEKVTKRLFDDKDDYLKFNVDGLLRGDITSRYEAYSKARQWGWQSGNDIRKKEDEDPVEGLDDYLQPMNMVPAGTAAAPANRAERSERTAQLQLSVRAADAPARYRPAWVTRTADVITDYFEQQRETLTLDGDGNLPDRSGWDEELASLLVRPFTGTTEEFGRDVAEELRGQFNPALVRNWIQGAADRAARNINITTYKQIEDLATDVSRDDSAAQIVNRVLGERSQHSDAIASALVNGVGSFARVEGAAQAGARSKTWIASGEDSRHAQLNGETVPISDKFSNGCGYPSDPDGGAAQVAGCRCGVEFAVGG